MFLHVIHVHTIVSCFDVTSNRTVNCWKSIIRKVKVGHSPSKKMSYLLGWKPFKNDENDENDAFYFILKVLFVLKVCKFLSGMFGHVGKTAWFER